MVCVLLFSPTFDKTNHLTQRVSTQYTISVTYSLRGTLPIHNLHDNSSQAIHRIVSAELVKKKRAIPALDTDIANVSFDRMRLRRKRHGEAPISLVESVAQTDRVIMAATGSPNDLAFEPEGGRERVAFNGVFLVLGPDVHSAVVLLNNGS